MNTTNTTKAKSLSSSLEQSRKASVSGFGSIEHRLELVDVINGVEYINDSKSTDVSSTWYSLEFLQKKVIWMVTESDVDIDYSVFADLIKDKVRVLICLGKNNNNSISQLGKLVEKFEIISTLEEAVSASSKMAKDGEVVLFSPACSSYHMFTSYKDRGEQFRRAVNSISL